MLVKGWVRQRTIFDFFKFFVSDENVFLINRRHSWLCSIGLILSRYCMFYELINVVFVERLRDLTFGIWLSLVEYSTWHPIEGCRYSPNSIKYYILFPPSPLRSYSTLEMKHLNQKLKIYHYVIHRGVTLGWTGAWAPLPPPLFLPSTSFLGSSPPSHLSQRGDKIISMIDLQWRALDGQRSVLLE